MALASDHEHASPPAPAREPAYDLAWTDPAAHPWHGAPRETVLLCTEQRSGSTLLGEALFFAGGLGCPLEYFHPGFRPAFARAWAAPDAARYVTALHRNRTDPGGVLSVKLFWSDVEDLVEEIAPGTLPALPMGDAAHVPDETYRRIAALLAPVFPHARYISLTRTDTLAQALSVSIAAQTHRWRRFAAAPVMDAEADATFDFDCIVQNLARFQNATAHWRRFFAANALTPYPLRYEALAADYAQSVRRLLDWLGRADAPIPAPRLHRQADARTDRLRARFLAEFHARCHARTSAAPAVSADAR